MNFGRTSTLVEGSKRDILGRAGEIVICKTLNGIVTYPVTVEHWRDVCPLMGQVETAIHNSENGDLYVCRDGIASHSIEAKCSEEHPNASISESELSFSNARYLVALTPTGIWACAMEAARAVARKLYYSDGSSWVIFRDRVQEVPLIEVVRC